MASSVGIKYKGNTLATMTQSGQKTLLTQGKYLEGNVLVEATLESGKEVVEWHQCPQLVRDFLDNVTYDPSDYTVSHIAEYAPATAVVSNTKPIGKTVDGVTFYNEVPNEVTPFATTNKAGTLKPLDFLRWINSATPNMRDLGGWACDGGTVKYGMLFRGGEPLASDKSLAQSLGIVHELNLRGNEVPIRDYSVWGIEYSQFNEYAYYGYSNRELYIKILRVVFDCINHNKPLYFHCQAGADRTGSVALLLEALLGMNQSDMDKEYELTTFSTGSGTDDNARRRNEDGWRLNITDITSTSLEGGLTDTFRNRAVSYVLSLGFTIDEINAFRNAMIDGNPTDITITPTSYTVTKTLSHITVDNPANTIQKYQPYVANVLPENGYVIESIQVKMGGVDVTAQVFKGEEVNLFRAVENTLTHCSSNNPKMAVIDGQGYTAELTADVGYTLDEEAGASIVITMGGTQIYPA